MPTQVTYPGVYIEEVPSGVRTITGVATSITAFVGFAKRGPVNEPTRVQSFAEFARTFGDLWDKSALTYAVRQYFLNGGRDAIIVRAAHLAGAGNLAKRGKLTIGTGNKALTLEAASEGAWSAANVPPWGAGLLVRIDQDTRDKNDATPRLFNLSIKDTATGQVEVLRNLPPDASLTRIVRLQSQLVSVSGTPPSARPDANADVPLGGDPFDASAPTQFTAFPTTGANAGADGDFVEADLVPAGDDGTGLFALARADLFNILCIPAVLRPSSTDTANVLSAGSRAAAAKFCLDHRALFLVDPDPAWRTAQNVTTNLGTFLGTMSADAQRNAALYFPNVRAADPLVNGAIDVFPPAGAIAGVMARTDAERGVWKAPAGIDASLAGVQELDVQLTDGQNGQLNPLGVSCLRTFPIYGNVVWGARTVAGADARASEWKYVPVRRTALFLEESLYRGTQWVVFEPNDEPLWAQIRLAVGAFMQNLFRQGAFQGKTPREAYFVKCDNETTTQADINLGIVNILVGFAPLKPAEFVIVRIQQLAGQIAT
jgi:phage tail sheath protein FI